MTSHSATPADMAVIDQMRAGIRDSIDLIITGLIDSDEVCRCGHAIDSDQHLAVLMGYLESGMSAPTQTLMLAEALTRLAVARKAAGA